MSTPTVLLLAPLPTDQCAEFAGLFDDLLMSVRSDPAVSGGLQSWTDPAASLTPEVQDVFWHAMADWSLFSDLSCAVDPSAPGVEVLATRKLAPMAVLLTGLGRERARLLPGVAGFWLLDPAGVREAAVEIRQVFTMSSSERSAIKARMTRAAALGDEPRFDLDRLLDAVPTAFAIAGETGMGLVSCSAVVS